jgi:SAM-dependent methyltransferase
MTPDTRRCFGMLFAVLSIACIARPTAAQAQGNPQSADVQTYEKFRAWVSSREVAATLTDQTSEEDIMRMYRRVLAAEGVSAPVIDRQIQVIADRGRQLEIDRWNRILTSPAAPFNRQPNGFLVRITRNARPGTALDVGMGQGRNAVYLAQQGWTVTGFDPAGQAVAAAQAEAARVGVKLTALAVDDAHFDFGKDRWDLIVLSYVGAREFVPRIYDSLKPGGMVVVEAFHRDATKNGPIGGAVVFDTNELLKLFERFRVIQYEDVEDVADFGMQKQRVVRLAAEKPFP